MTRSTLSFLRPLLLGLSLVGAATVAQALVNPPIRIAPQGVEYMCGGLGPDEAQFMAMVAPRWAATFEFAVKQPEGKAAVAGVTVQVRNTYNGEQVLTVQADAPYLLARLAPGAYTVEATLDGLTLIQPLQVVQGMGTRALFVWPSNLQMATQNQAAL
jgi:hypothetical protein